MQKIRKVQPSFLKTVGYGAPKLTVTTEAPTSSWLNHDLGDFILNKETRLAYMLMSKESSTATWAQVLGDGLDYQQSVLKQTTYASGVATEGNRYLSTATSGLWTADYIYEYSSGEWVGLAPSEGMVVFDEETAGYLLYSSAAWGSFTTGITTIAAATDTNIVTPATGEVLIWDGTNSWDNKALSGDVAVDAAGATTVSDLTIASEAQGDLLRRGAAAWERVSAKTDKQILIGDGTDVVSVAVTGDVAITNAGVTTVTGITVGSDAQGDVYFRGAAALERLGAGAAGQSLLSAGAAADVYWGSPSVASASSLANGCTLNDAGVLDAILAFTQQTVGAPTLTVPDFASVSDTFVFKTKAETLAGKTLTTPIIVTTGYIADAGGDEYLQFVESATPVNHIVVTQGDTGVSPMVTSAGEANIPLMLHANGTGNVQITDGGDITALIEFELDGATTGKTMTLTHSHTDDRAITYPDVTDTLCGITAVQALSNKTLTEPKIVTTGFIADAGGDEYLQFVESATPVNHVVITQGDTGVSPMITSGGEANIPLMLHADGTGNVQITDGGDITAKIEFELDGATTAKTMTLTHSHTDDRALTFPDATDTLVGKATGDTFTNKSYDCDGSGNVLTNVNMDEMDAETIPAADGNNVTVVDGLIIARVTNNATFFNIFNSNAPYAFIIIDAWSINTSADGGTWALNDTAGGGGTAITDTVTVAASDKDIDRATEIDDGAYAIAASGDLAVNLDGGGALDCYIYIRIARLA